METVVCAQQMGSVNFQEVQTGVHKYPAHPSLHRYRTKGQDLEQLTPPCAAGHNTLPLYFTFIHRGSAG